MLFGGLFLQSFHLIIFRQIIIVIFQTDFFGGISQNATEEIIVQSSDEMPPNRKRKPPAAPVSQPLLSQAVVSEPVAPPAKKQRTARTAIVSQAIGSQPQHVANAVNLEAALAQAALFTAAAQSANAMIDRRIVVGTKKQYANAITQFRNFYQAIGVPFEFPLQSTHIKAFFGHLSHTTDPKKTRRFQAIRGYKSALIWYFKEINQHVDADFDQELEKFLAGYRRHIADLKLDSVIPLIEGKSHLSFTGYQTLANQLLKLPNFKSMLFGWPFLVIQWNLISRSASTAALMFGHFRWEADSLIIELPKHKSDQDGDKIYPKHCFANRSNPAICPILALAVHSHNRFD